MTEPDPFLELVVFDMAGTTVYDDDFVHRALQGALRDAGVDVTREDVNAVMGRPKPLAIRSFLEKQAGDGQVLEDAVERTHEDFVERINDFYAADPAVREVEGATHLFESLREAGIKVGLDTGFSRSTADTIIDRLGWSEAGLLDATVTSDEVEHGRPQPDMIHRLMEMTDVEAAGRVAKLGDAPSDLQEGTNAGCALVIGVTNGSHTESQLKPYPHTHLLPSVTEAETLLLNGQDSEGESSA
ncbi:MAG: phosphonatase-like hydrolase [Salinibacter sp.]